MTSAAATATAIAGLLAALLGILRYFNYRTNKDRMAAVGTAFAEVVKGLSAEDVVQRAANAILLRRFVDRRSEFAVRAVVRRKVPYASDAVNVIAAVLRTERTGIVQQLLADGLAYAPTLAGTDLTHTNLRNGYLGARGDEHPPSMERVDLFHADLTRASFRKADLRRAVFYQATAVDTVFEDADLREADFRGADLSGARLTGARLAGAKFTRSSQLPAAIQSRLDDKDRYVASDDETFAPPPQPKVVGGVNARPTVFISTPSIADPSCRAVGEIVIGALRTEGASLERVERQDYSASSPLRVVTAAMRTCWGVVIVGLRQLHVQEASFRSGTPEQEVLKDVHLPTPWNQIEAGMAAALGLPLLIVSDCVTGGVFGLGTDGDDLRTISLGEDWAVRDVESAVREWTRGLRPPP